LTGAHTAGSHRTIAFESLDLAVRAAPGCLAELARALHGGRD
jgi:hypothetical protein